jgi:hypothetical protein
MIRYCFYLGTTATPRLDLALARGMDRDLATILDVLHAHDVDGATITPAFGLWAGEIERSYVVEILTTPDAALDLDAPALAERFRVAMAQAAVLVTTEPVGITVDVATGGA